MYLVPFSPMCFTDRANRHSMSSCPTVIWLLDISWGTFCCPSIIFPNWTITEFPMFYWRLGIPHPIMHKKSLYCAVMTGILNPKPKKKKGDCSPFMFNFQILQFPDLDRLPGSVFVPLRSRQQIPDQLNASSDYQ